MLRWFSNFDHIVSYISVKLFVLALMLVIMWVLIDRHLYLDAEQVSMLRDYLVDTLEQALL